MVNYSNGRIYKLVNDVDDKIYVGSTTSRLSIRKCHHKKDAKRRPNTRVYQHLNQIGWEHVDIVLIEKFECKSKEELHARERYWIETLKAELNTIIPTRTRKEWRQEHKEQLAQYFKERYENNKEQIAQKKKQYYENNKQQIAQQTKEYRENNKERIAQQKKEYSENNKEKIAHQQKQYRENNKEQIQRHKGQKYTCECGVVYTHSHKARHLRTQKHQKYIEQKN